MKQVEATPARPFYSVCYQYTANPWTLWSCNRFGGSRTMQGTSNFGLAKKIADKLVKERGICLAMVHKTTDCYNHSKVYEVTA